MSTMTHDRTLLIDLGDCVARITRTGETFTLEWDDGVANAWTESYGSLSSALARAALLASCAEADWVPCMRDDESEHVLRWSQYEDAALW